MPEPYWKDAKVLGMPVDDSVMVRVSITQAAWNAEAIKDRIEDQ